MISQKSSHNFYCMLRESIKKSLIPALVFFFYLIFLSIKTFISLSWDKKYNLEVFETFKENNTAFFFNGTFYADGVFWQNVLLIFFAVITALVLFSFQWSKKQCNVIYSLGMKRTEIYNARILGGIIPISAAVIISSGFETLSNLILGFNINGHYWLAVLYFTAHCILIYSLAFILCSVVFSNTGNVVEGLLFAGILSIFTMVLSLYFRENKLLYTLGASEYDINNPWNWSAPFIMDYIFNNGILYIVHAPNYFANPPEVNYNIYNFSGCISSVVYCVLIYVAGLFLIKKRKNETAGTWGKSKLATEVTSAALGLYAATYCLYVSRMSSNVPSLLSFIVGCLAFLITAIVFNLIFSSRRSLKKTLNRFPVYVGVFGIIAIIFSLGFFGYSGYIPEADKIDTVYVYSTSMKYNESNRWVDSLYGLKTMEIEPQQISHDDTSTLRFKDTEEIKKITKIHKSIIDDGKIKNSSPKACKNTLYFEYILNNGKRVYRLYEITTIETFKKIATINDTKTAKESLADYISFSENSKSFTHAIAQAVSKAIGKEVTVENYNVFNSDNEIIGVISTEYMVKEGPFETCFIDNDGSRIILDVNPDIMYSPDYTRFDNMENLNCFLFPKDMKKGYCIGMADDELFAALKSDIINQSSSHHYIHKPEDELGIISFGLSDSSYVSEGDDRSYDNNYTFDKNDNRVLKIKKGMYSEETSWNINSDDITAFVLTKDMVNTIKYLESHDLMKHFISPVKISDIKYVKLATKSELFGKPSKIFPIFYGAYWNASNVKFFDKINRQDSHIFNSVEEKVTDVERITKLIEGSVVFGLCPNDYRIMEITYNDGSLATVMVPYETYKAVIG